MSIDSSSLKPYVSELRKKAADIFGECKTIIAKSMRARPIEIETLKNKILEWISDLSVDLLMLEDKKLETRSLAFSKNNDLGEIIVDVRIIMRNLWNIVSQLDSRFKYTQNPTN
jgi:hypothetical protein